MDDDRPASSYGDRLTEPQFDARVDRIDVLDVAPHENFHRDLQRYMEAR